MAVTLAGAAAIWAQNPPQAPAPKPDAAAGASAPSQSDTTAKIITTVNTVILPVTVKDSSGHLVPDLTREEAYMIASVAVDYHVTQVVDGTKGIHGMIPKAIFAGR